MLKWIKNMLSGLVIGVANIIPGVSGGTMMVILNMFDKIIGAVSDFRKDVKGNIIFLFQILLGAAVGIILFSKLITYMLENHLVVTNFFFIGLILGSVPLVFRNAFPKEQLKDGKKSVKISSVIWFVLALALLIVISFTKTSETTTNIQTVTVTFPMLLQLFFGGIIAAIAMIIPGVSGSFVMVLLGIYPLVSGTAAALFPINVSLWMSTLIPIGVAAGLGIIIGLIVGAKLINLVLKRFTQQTYFGILGLLFGSLFCIYPGFLWNVEGVVAILVGLFGFALAFFSSSEKLKQYFEKKNQNA